MISSPPIFAVIAVLSVHCVGSTQQIKAEIVRGDRLSSLPYVTGQTVMGHVQMLHNADDLARLSLLPNNDDSGSAVNVLNFPGAALDTDGGCVSVLFCCFFRNLQAAKCVANGNQTTIRHFSTTHVHHLYMAKDTRQSLQHVSVSRLWQNEYVCISKRLVVVCNNFARVSTHAGQECRLEIHQPPSFGATKCQFHKMPKVSQTAVYRHRKVLCWPQPLWTETSCNTADVS